MVLKKDGMEYGQCTRILGECKFTIFCFDGKERMCQLRKAAKKKERVEIDTVVLVGLRDYQDEKGDIIFVYNREQTAALKGMHHIPSKVASAATMGDSENEDDDLGDDDEETGFDFAAI